MQLATPVSALPGIGSSYLWRLKQLNIETMEDLIFHFPFRYDDFSNVSSAREAQIGQKVTLKGEIWSINNIYTRSRKVLTQAVFNDGSLPITLTWFNQPWLIKNIQAGDKLQISGKLNKYKNKLTIVAPVWEKISNDQSLTTNSQSLHTGRLVPVYPETAGLTSKWLRSKIDLVLPKLLPEVSDPLPESIKNGMLTLNQAVKEVHFPQSYDSLNLARQRLAFDELFFIQLATQKARSQWKKKPTINSFKVNYKRLEKFISSLPFKLTAAQKKVIDEIIEDLTKNQPMNRLVQGEVGSGKTVVAAAIIYLAAQNGFNSLLMTPTEILAFQHHATLSKLLEPFGISVGIYTGSRKSFEDSKYITQNTNPKIIVGTHALLSDKLLTDNIGLIVVDEQQRFGVQQRSIFRNKAKVPHFLTMTATPIPRTVALTLYGDLDISIISELPKGRQQVKTFVVPAKKRNAAYDFIAKKVKAGDQVYIITPLIEQSESLISAKAAKVEFERLQKHVFPKLRLGLLHGRLKSKEKEAVINAFKEHRLDILVSTSVVEVGVDVANATIMVIEGAERFGLAQLHQLRGRVGRGVKESFCLLFTSTEDPALKSRLKNLEKTYDGLKLAELDLKIRGSGEIFGTRQSGRFELKIASFNDLGLIEKTKEAARKILTESPQLDKYPLLQAKLQDITANAMPD